MGRAKKMKMIRKAIKNANPDVPFELTKPYYKKIKKIILGKEFENDKK